jgi:hypothetical protein
MSLLCFQRGRSRRETLCPTFAHTPAPTTRIKPWPLCPYYYLRGRSRRETLCPTFTSPPLPTIIHYQDQALAFMSHLLPIFGRHQQHDPITFHDFPYHVMRHRYGAHFIPTLAIACALYSTSSHTCSHPIT